MGQMLHLQRFLLTCKQNDGESFVLRFKILSSGIFLNLKCSPDQSKMNPYTSLNTNILRDQIVSLSIVDSKTSFCISKKTLRSIDSQNKISSLI